jgi:hypothetical protein
MIKLSRRAARVTAEEEGLVCVAMVAHMWRISSSFIILTAGVSWNLFFVLTQAPDLRRGCHNLQNTKLKETNIKTASDSQMLRALLSRTLGAKSLI